MALPQSVFRGRWRVRRLPTSQWHWLPTKVPLRAIVVISEVPGRVRVRLGAKNSESRETI